MKRMGKSILALVLAYAMIIGNVGSGAFTSVAFAAEDAFGDYIVEESVAGTETTDDFAAPAVVDTDDAFAGADVVEETAAVVTDTVVDDVFAVAAEEATAVEAAEVDVFGDTVVTEEAEAEAVYDAASATQVTSIVLSDENATFTYDSTVKELTIKLENAAVTYTPASATENVTVSATQGTVTYTDDLYAGEKEVTVAKGTEVTENIALSDDVKVKFTIKAATLTAGNQGTLNVEVGETLSTDALASAVKIDGYDVETNGVTFGTPSAGSYTADGGFVAPATVGTVTIPVKLAKTDMGGTTDAEYNEDTNGALTITVVAKPVNVTELSLVNEGDLYVVVGDKLKISVATDGTVDTSSVSVKSNDSAILKTVGSAAYFMASGTQKVATFTVEGVKAGITTVLVTANDADEVYLPVGVQVVNSASEVLSVEKEVWDDLANYSGDIKALAFNSDGSPNLWIGGYESEYAYTGAKIKPAVNAYEGLTKLTLKKDYKVSYANNKKVTDSASIKVQFKGNYKGKAAVAGTFKIRAAKIGEDILVTPGIGTEAKIAKGKVAPVLTQASTGKTVKYKKNLFDLAVSGTQVTISAKSSNYTASATQAMYVATKATNITKGKITLTVTGIAEGSVADVKKNSKGKVTGVYYSGEAVNVIPVSGTQSVSTTQNAVSLSLKVNGKEYTSGSGDFTIEEVYNNVEPGKAVVVLKGNGTTLVGSKAFTFKIIKKPVGKKVALPEGWDVHFEIGNILGSAASALQTASNTQTASGTEAVSPTSASSTQIDPNMYYSKNKSKGQRIVVRNANGVRLVEGTDYTVAYKKDQQVGNNAELTIKLKGKKYSGSIIAKYTVKALDLSSQVAVIVAPKKSGVKVTVMSLVDGKNLASTGKNPVVKWDDKSGVITVEPIDTTNMTGKATVSYNSSATGNVAKGNFKVSPADYNGLAHTIKSGDLSVTSAKIGKTSLGNSDYTPVYYFNNVNKGNKAKVVLQGVNGYSYSKAVTFKIKAKTASTKAGVTIDKGVLSTTK